MMHPLLTLLAQSNPGGSVSGGSGGAGSSGADVIVWLIWLSVAAAAVGVAFWLIRKWVLREEAGPPSTGFTLSDLRQLHREGQLTDEQFEAAKAAMIARDLARYGGSTEADETSDSEVLSREKDTPALSDRVVNEDSPDSSDKNGQDDRPPPPP